MLRELFMNRGIALALFDRDLRLIDANDEFDQLVNHERKDYMSYGWKRMLDHASMEKVHTFATRRVKNPRSAPNQYEIGFEDGRGQQRHAIVNVSFMPSQGISLVSLTEITELKHYQEDLSKRNEMLQGLIERLYHDAQTPLVTLYSYSDLLCEAMRQENKDQADIYLKVIKDASVSLSDALRDVAVKGIHHPPSLTDDEFE